MEEKKYDNSGILFPNNKKETERHPDYQGKALIGGVDFWISGWKKTASNGGKFMSLSFKLNERYDKASASKKLPEQEIDLPF
jgi:uncharacterized protein (DUF736 family)